MPSEDPGHAAAALRATLRRLARDLEARCRQRCAHRGVGDVCHLAGPCRNRRRAGDRGFVCAADPHEARR